MEWQKIGMILILAIFMVACTRNVDDITAEPITGKVISVPDTIPEEFGGKSVSFEIAGPPESAIPYGDEEKPPSGIEVIARAVQETGSASCTISPMSTKAGETITITLSPTPTGISKDILFFSGEEYLDRITLECDDRCTQALDIPFRLPDKWSGTITIKFYDYGSQVWRKCDFETFGKPSSTDVDIPVTAHAGQDIVVDISGELSPHVLIQKDGDYLGVLTLCNAPTCTGRIPVSIPIWDGTYTLKFFGADIMPRSIRIDGVEITEMSIEIPKLQKDIPSDIEIQPSAQGMGPTWFVTDMRGSVILQGILDCAKFSRCFSAQRIRMLFPNVGVYQLHFFDGTEQTIQLEVS